MSPSPPPPMLRELQNEPLNAEPYVKELVQGYTPETQCYLRNHGEVPEKRTEAMKDCTISVGGAVDSPFEITLAELAKLPQWNVEAVLQCAGNRRKTMSERLGKTEGVQWGDGTAYNELWQGVSLSHLLSRAGIRADAAHIHFDARAQSVENDAYYAGSIPLAKALDRDTILATHINGEPLSLLHGAPVRVVVPGYVGARWVKWLTHIHASCEESPNYYQQKDYKVLPPSVKSADDAESQWAQFPALLEMPLNSVVTSVTRGPRGTDELQVDGYALPGYNNEVRTVQVSTDGGSSWAEANLRHRGGRWGWSLWTATVNHTGPGVALSRAVDSGGNVQEEEGTWNLRGICYNGYGRMEFS